MVARVVDTALNASTDPSSEELEIDLTAPVAPTVTAQLTNTDTPVISGTASTGTGETLSVEVNGVIYTVGDGNLIDNGDGSWDLTIPLADALVEGNYDVVARVVDTALNASTDPSSDELEIDLTAPVAPTVTAQLTNTDTPVISGTATVVTGETLSVEVNGVVYTDGDGHLVDNGDGTWDLTIPMGDALPEGLFDVMVTVIDAAGNSSSESSTNELTIDLTPPPTPTINSLLTNTGTPTLSGTATLGFGDIFTVTVNTVVYTPAEVNLVVNGCLLYTSPSPRDQRGSRMPSSA